MKLISYIHNDERRIGHLANSNKIIDITSYSKYTSLNDFITEEKYRSQKITDYIHSDKAVTVNIEEIKIIRPIKPRSVRDAYAFRQHVETSRKNRGLDMIKEFDQFPVYYYSNADGVIGPGDIIINDIFMEKLDFELEVAAVIGRKGRDVSCNEADDYIAGFMIMNDFSARHIQMEEMKLNLGPAKGKDFATSIGPAIVTLDE